MSRRPMIDAAALVPLAVALLALVGALAGVLVQRQKVRVEATKVATDERAEFMQAVLAEVQGLRVADQLNEARVTEILKQLQAAQVDILQCYKERNELATRVTLLQAQVDAFDARPARPPRRNRPTAG